MPQFSHKMSTLRHLFDTFATGGVSKLLFIYANGYRYISGVFDTEKYFFFLARVKKFRHIYHPVIQVTMPRKRRKAVASITPDIPYPRVRVEWIDCVSDSGWATDKEFDRMKLARPVNEGWLYCKDKKSIKLFASYDREDDGSFSFGDRTMIPRAWVKKIQKL